MLRDIEVAVGLFPGQGGYRKGFLRAHYARGEASVAEVFSVVDAVGRDQLRTSVTDRIFGDEPPTVEELFHLDPVALQLAIFAVSVCVHRLLQSRGARVDMLMGHSLGEIAALACGGAYSLADAAQIVCHRIEAVADCAAAQGRMTSLACSVDTADRILELVGDPMLRVAVDNGAHQCVIAGPTHGLDRVEAVASALDLRAIRLPAPASFHHPAMSRARAALVSVISDYPRGELNTPVYSPILGRFYRDSDDLSELLGLHLVTPVRFGHAVRRLRNSGAGIFVEMGAGSTLTTAVHTAFPEVATPALTGPDEDRALAEVAAFLTAGLPLPDATHSAVPVTTPPVEQTGHTAPDIEHSPVSHAEVFEVIRSIYSEAMEYPSEILVADAHLEADLGVDSIKRTELLVRILKHFELDDVVDQLELSSYETLGAVAEMVSQALSDTMVGSNP